MKAGDLMTKNPDTIGPNTTIHEVAKKFAVNRYHALPVVEDGALKGIITSNDLIKYILNE
jgi:CBS domain-containing protein